MSLFRDIFIFNPNEPFLFTNMAFWIYFAAVYFIYSLCYKNLTIRNAYLFLISIFFYYKTGGILILLLLFSILFNYSLALAIARSARQKVKKFWMITGVSVNLLILFYYKYTYFLFEWINKILGLHIQVKDYLAIAGNNLLNAHFDVASIILPIGISFFTFQALSYIIDVYKNSIPPLKSITEFGFYIAYFPQLVAGPIMRATEFIPQISRKFGLSKNEFGHAVFLILNGLVKKMVISDFISLNFVDRVFENPHMFSGIENLMAVYGYAIQIYCDFSGYTDIAIGLALLMGFRIPINFNSPYKAYSLVDFWRRWHISLSSWLRDYLYIALGGNRKGLVRTYANLIVTMLLGGLWHGANIKFVIWGALHGFGLVVNKLVAGILPKQTYTPVWQKTLGWIVTFHFVCFAWIFFRADSMETAFSIINNIATRLDLSLAVNIFYQYATTFVILALGFTVHWMPTNWKETYRGAFIKIPVYAKVAIALVCCLLIYQFKTSEIQPFIYFQF
jgi:D-alanyl-lipoteichoic acid acyltransferase DltB (MBOAT superfamily)